jgi:hypothetical protein
MFMDGRTYLSGAALRHAAVRAFRTVAFFASFNFTMVLPRRPQAPLDGAKTVGSERM